MSDVLYLWELLDPEMEEGAIYFIIECPEDKDRELRELLLTLQEEYEWDKYEDIEEVDRWVSEELEKIGAKNLDFRYISPETI